LIDLPLAPCPDGIDVEAWSALDIAAVSQLEVSVHKCSLTLQRELARVFSNVDTVLEHMKDVLALATFQPAQNDLVSIGAAVELEKDVKLAKFNAWCVKLCDELTRSGYWADFIDPCSGFPVRSARGASPYSEIDGLRSMLSYATSVAGPCVVVSHPRWNTRCYPASLFTTAPLDVVKAALKATSIDINHSFGDSFGS
jgi:hypothetical protein